MSHYVTVLSIFTMIKYTLNVKHAHINVLNVAIFPQNVSYVQKIGKISLLVSVLLVLLKIYHLHYVLLVLNNVNLVLVLLLSVINASEIE